MNFEDLQVVWDAQKSETLYTIDQVALRRLVDRDSAAINRDLRLLELAAIAVLIGLGWVTLIDTFFNGDEYFQLASVAFEFVAAGYLWIRRQRRESARNIELNSLLDRVDSAMNQARLTIQCGRDLAIVFSLFALYGVGIRMLVYGWRGSEIKLAVAIVCAVFLYACMKINETTTHLPRIRNLGSLRTKLLEV